MPKSVVENNEKTGTAEETNQVVISNATMISSLRIKAVNDIETMCKNSFSKRTSDMIMIAAPV